MKKKKLTDKLKDDKPSQASSSASPSPAPPAPPAKTEEDKMREWREQQETVRKARGERIRASHAEQDTFLGKLREAGKDLKRRFNYNDRVKR